MVNIAVLGYGTVGSGVVEVINTNHDIVNKRAGQEINVKRVLDLRTFPAEGDYESNPDIRNHLAVRYMWNKDHWDEFSKTFENLEYFFRSVEDCFVLRAEIAQLRDSMVPVRRLYLAIFDFADEFCY